MTAPEVNSSTAQTLPHGCWPSPVTADDVLGSSVSMSELRADGDQLYWLESRPLENGRMCVVTLTEAGVVEVSPAEINVRTRIWEYGGGAWDVRDGVLVVSEVTTGRVLRVSDGLATPLTPEGVDLRYGGLRVHPEQGLVLAVREDHRGDGEPPSAIVAIGLDANGDDEGCVLVTGADFHAGPRLSDQGELAWFEWDHPAMPWDSTRIMAGQLAPAADQRWTLKNQRKVFGRDGVSAQNPQWSPAGLVFSHDGSGFWNLNLDDGAALTPLHVDAHDHDTPTWVLTLPTWIPVGDQIVGQRLVDGWAELGWLRQGMFDPLPLSGLAAVDSCAVVDAAVFALVSFADRPAALVRIDGRGSQANVQVVHQPSPPPAVAPAPPVSLLVEGPHGPIQAWFHSPSHPDVVAPDGDLPPAIVKSHGGPTSFSPASHSTLVDFWTSRGFAVIDVNYGGSTGFGRAYRDRLKGQWGVVDVDDCVAVVDHLVAVGTIDPKRVSITGGSAGGYTTLQSLVTTSTYTAGVSRYGIGDLEMLATDTHKFESRYLDSLVGPYPADKQVYLDRSPVHHVDRLATPMLILQGLDDKVVPANQAESMARAVRAKGLPVALVTYEGEGHGFRGLAARRSALLTELAFYCTLWGIDSADDLPLLDLHRP